MQIAHIILNVLETLWKMYKLLINSHKILPTRTLKVLKHLKQTLKENNINVRTITKAVNSLKKSLPAEVGFAEISIETESEISHMELSREQNSTIFSPIDCELDATKEITISTIHVEAEN